MALFFGSGLTALVYQVLWLKELALLFGGTARSSAITLTVFFLGIALGSFAFGSRAKSYKNPIRVYGLLELGVAVSALAYFALLSTYFSVYGTLFQTLRDWPGGLTTLKVALSLVLLLPAAFFMGGTLPIVAQHLVRNRNELGATGSLLYALNTLGGALGAFLAGFYLPPLLGYDASYLTAIALNVLIAVVALAIGATGAAPAVAESAVAPRKSGATLQESWLLAIAAASGFSALGLEVLWTRMFAQVLHNSVYSFSLILVMFLLVLAGGALLARVIARRARDHGSALAWSLTATGLAVGATPFLFYAITGGLQYIGAKQGWSLYLWSVFGMAGGVLLVPGILLGSVFPQLLSLTRDEQGAGQAIGRLTALNTLGAIAGSLAAGFLMLEWLGLWASIRALAVLYLVLALLVADRLTAQPGRLRLAALGALVLLVTVADAARLPILPDFTHLTKPPAVHRIWEGRDGTVAVVSVGGDLRTIVDSYYSLGGTEKKQYEETQADLPLMLHPKPRSVFFLGLGTGITAGAALGHRVDRVVAAELSPEVVEASRTYFKDHTNGLFTDSRAEIVVEDGRQYLLATDERFDVVISDLFLPWQAGAGSLYSKEHFETVRDRLAPGGLFAQWLPLYQLSRGELDSIVRTMLEIFPQVTLWRGDFLPDHPIVALIGSNDEKPLDPEALIDNYRHRRGDPSLARDSVLGLMGMFYAGNLGAARDAFATAPINTDDLPIIEYAAPVTHREQRAGTAHWLINRDLVDWYRSLAARVPPRQDPYLSRLSEHEIGFTEAGLLLLDAQVSAKEGKSESAQALLEGFAGKVPAPIAARFKPREPSAGAKQERSSR